MTDRELRRLGRAELVDIIYELQSRNQQCEAEIEKLQKALDDKILKIASAGSIAEAALKLSGIFEAAQAVRRAIAAGVRVCGENRVQELTAKLADSAYEGAQIHFIGHLQTNKVKQVVGKVDLIQSVDSLRLLEAIDREAERQGLTQAVLLEVNIGGEASKSGFAKEGLLERAHQRAALWVEAR